MSLPVVFVRDILACGLKLSSKVIFDAVINDDNDFVVVGFSTEGSAIETLLLT